MVEPLHDSFHNEVRDRIRFAVLRGGNWNGGDNYGVFSTNLNNGPTNTNNNIGFRCAVSPPLRLKKQSVLISRLEQLHAKS